MVQKMWFLRFLIPLLHSGAARHLALRGQATFHGAHVALQKRRSLRRLRK